MNNKKMMAGLLTAGLLLVPNAALAESTDVNLIVNDTHVVSSEAEGQVYINDAGRTMIPRRIAPSGAQERPPAARRDSTMTASASAATSG